MTISGMDEGYLVPGNARETSMFAIPQNIAMPLSWIGIGLLLISLPKDILLLILFLFLLLTHLMLSGFGHLLFGT